MNYNSINDILSSGITNMEVIRNNSKQDDGNDTITGVDWFTFNGSTVSNIYVNGNSFIGFGTNSEHLKVNKRDGAMYYLYREEGTLYNHYKFLKIRWVGYSYYGSTSSTYKVEYDVIIWDTGDISLHMISIPTKYNDGGYSLVTSSKTYSYTVSTSSPDVTFIKTDSGFEVNNNIIDLDFPYVKYYMVRSGSSYYTVVNDILTEINVADLTSDVFLNNGINYIPDISLLNDLINPEIIFWIDNDNVILKKGLIIKGTPLMPHAIYYETQNLSDSTSIKKAEVKASDDVMFTITFDDGQTWNYYNGTNWVQSTSLTEGMRANTLKNITQEQWASITTSNTYQFRGALMDVNSEAGQIYINTI